MAGQNWRKNKKGFMVNPEGKTARQVKQEKYAAKKAEAKAKVSGGGGSGGGEFTQKTVSILNREGKARKVKGEVLGDYVISAGGNDAYSIHHVPTGLEITSSIGFKTRNPAKYEQLGEKEAARLAVRKLVDANIDIPDSYSKWDKSSTDKKAKIGQDIVDAFDDKKTTAKPASKGSEEIDPSRYLESNTSKTINTAYRVNKFDIDMVSSRKKAGDFDVEGEARKIASAGGVTTNLPLVAMRQDKKIEVVAGDREFYANKRAQELNSNEEMVSGVFLKSSQIKGALSQKSLFKDHEGDFTVKSGQFSRVDTADIESSIKQPSKKVLDAQVKALLDTGDVGNVIPVILQRVGKKSAVNQKYKVVSGHDSFLAMRELKRRDPNYEMTNAFILD